MKVWRLVVAVAGMLVLGWIGLAVQDSKHENQERPSPAERQNSPPASGMVDGHQPPNEAERGQDKKWYEPFLEKGVKALEWVSGLFEKPTDFLLLAFNGLLALFTWRLYVATRGLLGETAGLRTAADQQSKDMQKTIKAATDSAQAAIGANQISVTNSERQLRAYVTSGSLVLNHYKAHSGFMPHTFERVYTTAKYGIHVVFANGGSTPAVNAIINVNSKRFTGGIPVDFNFPDSETYQHALIGPGQEWQAFICDCSPQDIENTRREWYFWGWIEYDDIFIGTSRHRTEFCFCVEYYNTPPLTEMLFRYIAHPEYNATDDRCMRPFDPVENKYG